MQIHPQDLKRIVIEWQNRFPLDRWYRNKYKIPFGSSAHLEANQIDVLFEYLEEKAWKECSEELEQQDKRNAALKEHGWLSPINDISDEDFDKIVI